MDWRIKRLGQAIITVYAVMTLSFILIRGMPGSATDYLMYQLMEEGEDPRAAAQMVEMYSNINPEKPIHIAYFDYMVAFMQGDLGISVWYRRPVAEIMAAALPWTVFVMSIATLSSFLIGISLGGIMAYWEGSKSDVSLSVLATVMSSVPFYVIALLLLSWLAFRANWFPTGGRYPTGTSPGWNIPFLLGAVHHAILPILSMVLAGFGGTALAMRGNAIQILGEDYMRVARLRGLPDKRISLRYVSRNALLPLYTGLMISIGSAFGGSVILEIIYRYPGMGWYMIQGVNARDHILMMGAFTIITMAVVVALVIADLTYGYLDPRARGGETDAY